MPAAVPQDWNGRSDPYVELRTVGVKRQAKTIRGTFKSRASSLEAVPCFPHPYPHRCPPLTTPCCHVVDPSVANDATLP